MTQITLYLDEETEALVATQAKATGQSKSRWVAELIRRHGDPSSSHPGDTQGESFPAFRN